MQPAPPPSTLAVDYFDGRSARATAVTLRLMGDLLLIDGEGVSRREPVGAVQWPERTRHGTRVAHLADGASLHCADALAWDRWMRAGGHHESAVVTAQQSWRGVLVSLVLIVGVLVAIYEWGVPAASRGVVALMPRSVDAAIGEQALASIDEHLMKPSRLPAEQQQQLRSAFSRAVATLPPGEAPAYQLLFRSSDIGPNAFALPGGSIILTDELVQLVDGDEQVITGVLAHELGHVQHRHGMRMLVQVTALGALASVVVGDFSSLLAGVPALLGQAGYSRDAERESDREAVRVLKAAGISPRVMVTFFERIGEWREDEPSESDGNGKSSDSPLGIAISSHPADAERIRFFEDAARP